MKNRNFAILVGLLLPMACCLPPGQRLLTVQIELDGVITFEGIRGVPDYIPVDQMWDVLQDVPFHLRNASATKPDSPDANACSLNGKIVVRIQHVDEELDTAKLTSLTLCKGESGSSWLLKEGEALRVKRAKTH